MEQPDIEMNDPRVLVQKAGTGTGWESISRELVRIDGVIWSRLISICGIPEDECDWEIVPETVEAGGWKDWTGEIIRAVTMPYPTYTEFSAALDRHEIELAHRVETGVPALSDGAL